MALVRTTLSAAVGVDDTSIVVASATSIVAGRIIRVDQEWMVVQKDYSSGTTVNVRRGQLGSKTSAHVVTAGVVHGDAADFDTPGAAVPVNSPIVRPVVITSITATGTLTHAPAGSDHRVILNGTDVITLTVPVPTVDMDGDQLTIISNGAAAHVPTFTGGLGGAGASYDAVTNNATGKFALTVFAANATWQIPVAPAMTGTVTNITAGIA